MNRLVVWLGLLALIGLAVAVGVGLYATYSQLGVEISWFGWAAMAAGTLLSFGLAGGLMWLMSYSSRNGFDARQPLDDPPES